MRFIVLASDWLFPKARRLWRERAAIFQGLFYEASQLLFSGYTLRLQFAVCGLRSFTISYCICIAKSMWLFLYLFSKLFSLVLVRRTSMCKLTVLVTRNTVCSLVINTVIAHFLLAPNVMAMADMKALSIENNWDIVCFVQLYTYWSTLIDLKIFIS